MSKYNVDKTYFEKVDTEHKAYFLGYLYADGYVCDSTVQLQLHNKDIEILEYLNKEISPNTNMISPIAKNMARVNIYSVKLSKDIQNLGCVKNKTFLLKFPNIEEKFINHFIRGYFDGDGCITFNKNSSEFSILGTESFCVSCKEVFLKYIDDTMTISISLHGKNKNIHRIRVCSKASIIKILNWLYEDSNISLSRKLNKFKEFIEFNNRVKRVNQYC